MMSAIGDLLFKPTIAARMLRLLAERGSMSQAEFMREYHRRCERPDPSKAKSSFRCNFGRYTSGRHYAITRTRDPKQTRLKILHWAPGDIDLILGSLTDKQMTDAYASLEALLQDHPPGTLRETDDLDETARWVGRLKAETIRRATATTHRSVSHG